MKHVFRKEVLFGGLFIAGVSLNSFAQCINQQNVFPFTHKGNSYGVVKEARTWEEAAACAASVQGHLVHIQDTAEQRAVYGAIQLAGIPVNYSPVANGGGISYVWIGATDRNTEGTWMWDGDNDNNGTTFWTGQGAAGVGGGTSSGYVNWGGTSVGTKNEPDDYLVQDGAAIALSNWPYGIAGEWNDIAVENRQYFVIEFETSALGLNSSTADASFKMSPNPCKNSLEITSKSEILNFRILGLDGTSYLSGAEANSTQLSLNVENLPSGMYVVVLESKGNQQSTLKFIKE